MQKEVRYMHIFCRMNNVKKKSATAKQSKFSAEITLCGNTFAIYAIYAAKITAADYPTCV